ncbi:hypothetical protein Tco_1125097 [Tanacetum coccineum]|uniref:Uncharacterized protein n=1 Tax=Tanacetum coccineum TaxID=301880 RepID=A0ABQ5J808_9ASTR
MYTLLRLFIFQNSNGPSSWGILLVNAGEILEMEPYEEVAQQGQAHPLSPAYVPDPMELDEHVPVYVPELEHPKYHAPSYDDIQVEDRPYADDASPTTESPGYIADSDSTEEDTDVDSIDYLDEPEDGEEDDNEDPEEDPSKEHDPDDDDDDDDTDEEEEEHLAPADSSMVPVVDLVPSAGDTEAFETLHLDHLRLGSLFLRHVSIGHGRLSDLSHLCQHLWKAAIAEHVVQRHLYHPPTQLDPRPPLGHMAPSDPIEMTLQRRTDATSE